MTILVIKRKFCKETRFLTPDDRALIPIHEKSVFFLCLTNHCRKNSKIRFLAAGISQGEIFYDQSRSLPICVPTIQPDRVIPYGDRDWYL